MRICGKKDIILPKEVFFPKVLLTIVRFVLTNAMMYSYSKKEREEIIRLVKRMLLG